MSITKSTYEAKVIFMLLLLCPAVGYFVHVYLAEIHRWTLGASMTAAIATAFLLFAAMLVLLRRRERRRRIE